MDFKFPYTGYAGQLSMIRGNLRPSVSIFLFYSRIHRSSHQRCSVRKAVLRNFAKFTGKHLPVPESLFNKAAGLGVQLY